MRQRNAAWGNEGHEIVALIADDRLAPPVRQTVHAILRADPDPLTAPDFARPTTRADRSRGSDRNGTQVRYQATRASHFADIEIDGGSLGGACPDHSADPATPASRGPADDCVVRKVLGQARRFGEPAGRAPAGAEVVLHFVGDLHQPLHAADHQDACGNRVLLSMQDKCRTAWGTVLAGDACVTARSTPWLYQVDARPDSGLESKSAIPGHGNGLLRVSAGTADLTALRQGWKPVRGQTPVPRWLDAKRDSPAPRSG